MDEEIIFRQSAFDHGFTREDILNACENYFEDRPMDDDENKRLIIGPDHKGQLLEVMYNVINENRINIFHAMIARESLLKRLDRRDNK